MFLLSTKCFVVLLIIVQNAASFGFQLTIKPNATEILLNEDDTLEITCTSLKKMVFFYPSDSTNTLVLSPVDIKETEQNGIHTISLRRNKTLHGDTGRYGCAHVDEEHDTKWTYVYVKSNTSLFVESDGYITLGVTANGSVTIPCRPTSPEYKVVLYGNEENIIDDAENISFNRTEGFTIRGIGWRDGGFYKCVITENNYTEEINFSVQVHRVVDLDAPIINEDPLRHVTRGQTLRVNCTACMEKDIRFSLYWIAPKNDDRIKIKTHQIPIAEISNTVYAVSELEIVEVNDGDAGNYTCEIKTFSRTKSTSVNLTVHDPSISFINLSSDKTVYKRNDGQEIQWVVSINAYPTPEITWFNPMGNAIIENSLERFSVNTSERFTVLRIEKLQVTDMGLYVLQAKSSTLPKVETVNFTLEVMAKPIVNDLENIKNYYMLNEIAKFRCDAAAYPLPNITWSFQAHEDSMIQILNNTEEVVNKTSCSSTVKLLIESTGIIKCTASNSLGDYSVERMIFATDISDGLGIIHPKQKITEGDTVELICAGSVYNFTDEIEWLDRNYQPLILTDRINITKTRTPFTYSAVLTFNPVNKSDTNNYICRLNSKNYTPMDVEYTLKVNDEMAPNFIYTNMNGTEITYEIENNSLKSINLKCDADGMPEPVITWWKDGERINMNDQNSTGMCDIIFISKKELNIEHLYGTQCSGKYLCRAENRLNSIESYQQITVERIGWNEKSQRVLVILFVILVIVCVIMVISFSIKIHREKVMRKQLMEAGLTHFEEGAMECLNPDLTVDDQADLLPYEKKWEFPRDNLKLGKQLGCGAFGVVMKAQAQGICEEESTTTVAVKMVRRSTESTYIRALASELKIMVHLGKHLNVVNLLGACTKNIAKRELLVIVEYCRFGNLRNYLLRHRSEFINQIDPTTEKIDLLIGSDLLVRSGSVESSNRIKYAALSFSRSLSIGSSNESDSAQFSTGLDSQGISMAPDGMVLSNNSIQPSWRSNYRGDYKDHNLKPICTQDLLSWAFQVARGMEYLSQRKVLHGDLAARNILLAEDNVVKICDFGLAKTMYKDENYKKKGDAPLPIKWMAIESIRDRVFSTQSDIWSFGIVLWEFFTLAETPYPGMEAKKQYLKLIEGYRMEKPEFSTKEVYDIMIQCWKAKPSLRPTFTDLVKSIGELLDESVKMHYVDLNNPYLHMNTIFMEGREKDYLTMMSAPNHEVLASQNQIYVNDPCFPTSAGTDSTYLCMSPASQNNESGIFSPREENEKSHFEFPSLENKSPNNPDSDSEAVELSPMLKNDDDPYLKPINIQERRAEFTRQRQAMRDAERKKLMERDSGYYNTPQNLPMFNSDDQNAKDENDAASIKSSNGINSNGYIPGIIRTHDNYGNMPKQKNDLKNDVPDSFTNPSYIMMGTKNEESTSV